jgi:hypothetical protein
LHEGDPAGNGEGDKGGDGDQGILVNLLEDVNALGQLPEGGNDEAKHGQAAVDDLRAQAVICLDLCRMANNNDSVANNNDNRSGTLFGYTCPISVAGDPEHA